MKPTIDREWFERRVQLEEGLDVTAGLPLPEALPDSADEFVGDSVDDAKQLP
jgi:hypothetical protein